MLILADDWKDYEIIDAGNGEKLERWKNIVLRRPDPQAIWPADTDNVSGKMSMDIIIEVAKVEEPGSLKRKFLKDGLYLIRDYLFI